MLREIVMPKLGETTEEGTVQQWRVSVGDAVRKGDVIMGVETDKAVIEVESLVEGVIRQILVGVGQPVPIGRVLAYVGDPQDVLPDPEKGASPSSGPRRL